MADDTVTTAQVVFTPSGLNGRFAVGTNLLDAARGLGVDLDTVCGGRAICGRCQITPEVGQFAKWGITSSAEAISEPGPSELDYRGARPLTPPNRLGCQAVVEGDVVVDVPPESQIHKQVVRKELGDDPLAIDPVLERFMVEVADGGLEASISEWTAIKERLRSEWSLDDLDIDPRALPQIQPALKRGGRKVTCVVNRSSGTAVAFRPGYLEQLYGVALDIGSTTVAGYLCDLESGTILASAGVMNPQIRMGEDLMSRVSYAMMNDGGAAELTAAIQRAISDLVVTLAAEAQIDVDDIFDVTVVGNPVMHHLFLGIDPTPLGVAPFALATGEAVRARASDVGIGSASASAYVLPCIGGHVGADTASAVLAQNLHHEHDPAVLIDVGTNAEIVVTDGERLFAASSPTGPALEGAQISCGVRATAGAIERIRVDPVTLEPRFKVIGCDLWSDEAGFDAATKDLEISGLAGSAIVEIIGELFLAGVIAPDGTMTDQRARSSRIEPFERTFSYLIRTGSPTLRLTQADVRAIQLAKAALRAGIDLLTERAGINQLSRVELAGAFGSHLDPAYTLLLGLVPDNEPAAVRSVGNAAGRGAVQALVSGQRRAEVEELARQIEKVETATEPRFQELFVQAMAIPHVQPTPQLAQIFSLPAPQPTGTRRRRGRTPTRPEVNDD